MSNDRIKIIFRSRCHGKRYLQQLTIEHLKKNWPKPLNAECIALDEWQSIVNFRIDDEMPR